MSGDLVQKLKRAGEQVLGAKGLTGNDHVRLSALLKVAALEIEALRVAEGVARDDAADLEAQLSQWRSAYIEVAGFLGLVSTDDTGRIGAVAGMEEVLAELEQRERNAAELRAALREWAEATQDAEWFELDQSNAYGGDHREAEDRVEAARRALLALAASEGQS